ncbi:MAG: cupin domain-containing protein [Acidimicrobiia bacterium]
MTAALSAEAGTGTLSRCVADVEAFLRSHWSRAPFVLARPGPAGFEDLLTLSDVDVILSTMPLRLPLFSMVQDGKPLDPRGFSSAGHQEPAGTPDALAVSEHFSRGATLILYRLNRWWPPLVRFCRLLELELTHPVTAAAFLTPARSQGLEVHRDDQEVFVLQTTGTKEWSVWGRPPGEPFLTGGVAREQLGDPVLSDVLRPGDCLYVPRGCPHVARGREETSLHVSVGVHPVTYRDVLRRAVDTLRSPALDEGLPPGFAHDGALPPELGRGLRSLAGALGGADPGELVEGVRQDHLRRQAPLLDGHLFDVGSLDLVDDVTVVGRRPGASLRLERNGPGQAATAVVNHRRLPVTAEVAAALEWVDKRSPLAVGDLAPQLDGDARHRLVGDLLRVGYLQLVR